MLHRPKNTAERLALRKAFIPAGATPILEHTNGSELYTYERAGGLYAIAFCGTAAKPSLHYRYRSEEARYDAIQRFKADIERAAAYRSTTRRARAAAVNTLKVGDILHTCWGYDQTNVDFYVVTRTVGKTRVYVRAIKADYEATGFMSGKTWPAMPIEMVGPETMHVSRGNSITVKGHHASLEDGREHCTTSYA